MPNIFLDCCEDQPAANATKQWREDLGFTVLGIVSDVSVINRVIISIDGSGVPSDDSDTDYYPDGAAATAPPKFFVVSTG